MLIIPSFMPPAKPNIVIIVADDLGYRDLGCYGAIELKTPNIDSLAADGVRATMAYAASPVCAPSRAALMTGRYPQRFGFEFNLNYDVAAVNPYGLPVDQRNLAELLRSEGYSTGMVGKWHLGVQDQFLPNRRGFDQAFYFLDGSTSYLPDGPKPMRPMYENGNPVAVSQYLTDEFTDQAVQFIQNQPVGGKPYLLYMAYNAPHGPLHATDEYLNRFPLLTGNRKKLAAMIAAVDDGVGSIRDAIRARGDESNTIVLFLSDNGGVEENGSSNEPWRGGKFELTEGGIRIPFIMSWPDKLPRLSTYIQPISALDVVPTIMRSLNRPIKRYDGGDLLPFFRGERTNRLHNELFWRFGDAAAARVDTYKILKEQANTPFKLFSELDAKELIDIRLLRQSRFAKARTRFSGWEKKMISPAWPNPRDE